MLVSGSILTYLSINNSSNFEELTEKRITEAQKTIIELYSQHFQSTLELLSESLVKKIKNDSLYLQEGHFKFENSLIKEYMIITKNGVLTRPHFIPDSFDSNYIDSPLSYVQRFLQAEQAEFVRNDYATAETLYSNSLKYTKFEADSAKVYNALARLKIKKNDQKSAIPLYRKLITEFNFTLNEFGFPYAYFSLNQLLKIDDLKLKNDKEQLIVTFLKGLQDNDIPYNNATSDLIEDIKTEIEGIQDLSDREVIDSIIMSVSNTILDIQNYEPLLRTVATEHNTNQLLRLQDFLVINNENSTNEIMLLYQLPENNVGFIVKLEDIDNLLLQDLNFSKGNFEYNLELIEATTNGHIFDKNFLLQSSFSPYFSAKQLQVGLKDRTKVDEFIFRRKLATAVGLILLLGAMIIGLLTLIQDVNRKKRMVQLRADFISNVTHEFKTPLTSINMFADSIVLDRVKEGKDIKKYAHVILKESEKLKRMITNILDFSKKENDKLTYHLKEEDLAEIVRSIMDEMNYWLEIHNFEVNLAVEENIRAVVDQEGLKQVLSNLITNAIKYSDSKKKIEIRLYKKENKAFIEVEDHGIGIPEDKLSAIFEKFYRVNSKENESVSGTGLGLTVSKDIVEAQNGKLYVSSCVNKGSKFTIELKI